MNDETFGLEVYNQELRNAVGAARSWLESPDRWLTLCGQCGTGKTHLAKALYAAYRCRVTRSFDSHSGIGSRSERERKQCFRWVDVLRTMRQGDFGIVDYISDLNMVVIDDIGAGFESDLGRAKAVEIAERRLGRPTIWTANLRLEQIGEVIDARLASRMLRQGSLVVEFEETEDWEVRRRAS